MKIIIKDYPQLNFLLWNRKKAAVLTEEEAFALYERNWKHIDEKSLTQKEREFIDMLKEKFGYGVMQNKLN